MSREVLEPQRTKHCIILLQTNPDRYADPVLNIKRGHLYVIIIIVHQCFNVFPMGIVFKVNVRCRVQDL
jgi:hypothetical protein